MKRVTCYKHTDSEKNIGKESGREFSIFYDKGSMWALYADGNIKCVANRDDRHILEDAVVNGDLISYEYDLPCSHSWYDIYPSFADSSRPTGRRCSKCNKQEFY